MANLGLEQRQIANTIAKVGRQMGASKRDIQIALMVAQTESGFSTSAVGDGGDALGVFQQHASWGSVASRTDAASSAKAFYRGLFGVRDRNRMDPWVAAQAVQRSAYSDGSNYKANWQLGQRVVTALPPGGGASFKASSDTGGYVMAAPLSAQELAEQYGFAMAFLKSHKDVWAKFQQAISQTGGGQWTPDKFIAELKNTHWWKTTANSVRQYQILKAQDPATLNARRSELAAQIADRAGTMGAALSKNALARITQNALMFGWNDSQIGDTLSSYVHTMNSVYNGQAGTDAGQLQQTAWRNGVKMSSATTQSWVQSIAAGKTSVNYYQELLRKQAKTLAPGFANELDSGMDLWDIASPYLQSKAQILQLDPASIDLFDSDVRSALSAKGADGKPTSKSLWQFEQDMRNDPRYLKTDTARDQAYSTAHHVLTDMGLIGQ